MRGYLVGFFDTWGNDRGTQIIGYYTTWKKAVSVSKTAEAENVFKHRSMRKVFIVEIEPNKNNTITDYLNWTNNYRNYDISTEPNFTVTDIKSGRICTTDF